MKIISPLIRSRLKGKRTGNAVVRSTLEMVLKEVEKQMIPEEGSRIASHRDFKTNEAFYEPHKTMKSCGVEQSRY